MRYLVWLLVLLCLAPGRGDAPRVLQVSAASSLTDAFGQLGREFEALHPGVRVVYNFAGSQQLLHQVSQGAPVDVLATADSSQMEAAVREGLVGPGASQVLARNRLVVIAPRENPAGLRQLSDLGRPGLKLVLADRRVPVGAYTLEMLERAGLDREYGAAFPRAVLGNVVSYEQNTRAVLAKVALGEADAGVVYATDLRAQRVAAIAIPDRLNPTAVYPIAVVARPKSPAEARAFVQFALSPAGQKVLVRHGFLGR